MLVSPFVIALGSVIGGAITETTTDVFLGPVVQKARDKLLEKFKLGKYESIDRSLKGAHIDVIENFATDDEKHTVHNVLTPLLDSQSSQPLAEFSKAVTQIYLFPTAHEIDSQPLIKQYRKFSNPSALVKGEIPDEASLTAIFDSFFQAFRERLLREADFAHLRDFFQLVETREQTKLLRTIAQNTASSDNDDFTAIKQEYLAYLVNEYKDLTIRGFAPQVGSRVVSLSLAKVFLPLQAIEGRPALAEYAEEDLRRQALSQVSNELDWQRRREEMEKRLVQLNASRSAQRSLGLAEFLKESRAVLLGDPGTGKTTTTRYITYALAADDTKNIGENVRGLTPVLVRIANYAKAFEKDRTLHLVEYIEKELMPRPEFGRYLRHAIEEGNCLIILDGLDEVAVTNLRIDVTQRIQSMVASFGDNHYIVSSRIVGYTASPLTREFTHATIQELTQEDRERFIHLWYNAINDEIGTSEHTVVR
ncbi:MAG: hypothetical protein R3A44_17840 [Caldilineaceae bacterium]